MALSSVDKSSAIPRVELYMLYGSLFLLFLTCTEISPFREISVLLWLGTFTFLAVRNIGAGLGLYIAALALYSNHYAHGGFAFINRPDHSALFILLVCLLFRLAKKVPHRLFAPLALVAALYIGMSLADSIRTGSLTGVELAIMARSTGIGLLLMLLLIRIRIDRRDIDAAFHVIIVLAVYSAIISVMWFTDARPLIYPTWLNDPEINRYFYHEARAGGLLMQGGWNAVLLTMALCIAVLRLQRAQGFGRAMLFVTTIVLGCGIYVTYTRAAYLAIIPALFVLLWMSPRVRKRALRRVVLACVCTVAILGLVWAAPSQLAARMGNEATVEFRLAAWDLALRMIASKPLLGHGFRGYEENAAEYFSGSEVFTLAGLRAEAPTVHNTTLNIAVEQGLIGLGLYVVMLILAYRIAKAGAVSVWGRYGKIWLLAYMGVFILQVQFSLAREPTTAVMFYGILGLLGGLVSGGGPSSPAKPMKRRSAGLCYASQQSSTVDGPHD